MTQIKKLFNIHYGQRAYHAKGNLENGETILISSQRVDAGCYGFFDIRELPTPEGVGFLGN